MVLNSLTYGRYGCHINTLRPRQNYCHFADNIFKCILLNENVWILLMFSLNFVPYVWINNIPALVQTMAWCRPGDKPLPEPMMVSLPMQLCVTQPHSVKSGGCFTNVSRTLQDTSLKMFFFRNRTSYENFKLKLCMCTQSHALGTHTKFQPEILTINVISEIVYFSQDYFGELVNNPQYFSNSYPG